MKNIHFFLIFLGLLNYHFAQCQGESYSLVNLIENYSHKSGIQFAYNPAQFSDINLTSDIALNNEKDLEKLLKDSNIQFQKINSQRWLLKIAKRIDDELLKGVTFTGLVKEGADEPLVSALIFTEGAEYSSLTNLDGQFTLDIPNMDSYKICCQYLGYEIKCIDSKEIINNNIEFELEPKFIKIDDVLIHSKRLKFTISPISDSETMVINGSEANNAALGKDVLRTVQLFSGVDATNDLSATLRIRAAEGLQSFLTLDGIPVYNPESAFGIFSVLNPLAVTKTRLYKNALPLEYGEFTGGYLECEGLIKQQNELQIDIDVSTLKSAFGIQLPINKNTQVSGAIRRTNGKISNQQFYSKLRKERESTPQLNNVFDRPKVIDTELENTFGDLYLNIIHETKGNIKFAATVFANRDNSGSDYENDYFFQRNNSSNNNRRIDISEQLIQERFKTNSGLSLNAVKTFKNDSKLSVLLYASRYILNDKVEASVVFDDRAKQIQKTNVLTSNIYNKIVDNDLKIQYETDPNKLFALKAGVDFRSIQSDFNFTVNKDTLRLPKTIPSLIPYIGLTFNYNERLTAKLGNRTSIVSGEKRLQVFLSPRFSTQFKIKEGYYLKASLSHNEQFFRPLEIERQLGQSVSVNILANSRGIPILKSNQATLGGSIKKGAFNITGDIYIRQNLGITQQVLRIPGINNDDSNIFGNNEYQLLSGDNRVIGFDVSSFISFKKFDGIISYTLSKSEDRFEELFNNQYLPTQNNRLHQWNLFGSFDYKKWNFNTTLIYGSGVYTLNREILENTNRPNIQPSKLFKQLPNYRRWDLGVSYAIDVKYGELNLDLSLYNVLNNENINSEIYIYQTQVNDKKGLGAAEVQLLNRTWNVGIRYTL